MAPCSKSLFSLSLFNFLASGKHASLWGRRIMLDHSGARLNPRLAWRRRRRQGEIASEHVSVDFSLLDHTAYIGISKLKGTSWDEIQLHFRGRAADDVMLLIYAEVTARRMIDCAGRHSIRLFFGP